VYLPLGVYWIVLFILTTIPSDSLPSVGGIDKIEHFLAYTVLTFLLGLAVQFKSNYRLNYKEKFLVVFSISLTYSVFDELHQIPIRGRYFDWLDLGANFIGILIGLAVLRWFLSSHINDKSSSEYGTNT
jgi:VanZ family protein